MAETFKRSYNCGRLFVVIALDEGFKVCLGPGAILAAGVVGPC